jgi:uncharacterized membrane protein
MRAFSRLLLVAPILLATLTGSASAQVTLEYIGTGLATDVSEDGSVVTGLAGLSWEVFRWTEGTGIVPLGRIAPAQAGTPDVSDDGTRISGTIASVDSAWATPGLWIEGQGWTELMPPMLSDGGELGNALGSAWGMSGDGRTVVGLYWRPGQSDGSAHGFAWHSIAGGSGLGSGGRQSRASDVNYDGSVIVGFDENPGFGNRWPAVWVDGVKTILGESDMFVEATAVNNDGTIVGGTYNAEGSDLREAALWRWNGASWDLELLGAMFGTNPLYGSAQVNDMTPGGEIVVGINSYGGGSADGFIWTPEGGMQEIGDYMLANGISIDPNFDLLSVTAITSDGSVMIGTARETVEPWDYKSWILRQPARATNAPTPTPIVVSRLGSNYPNPFNPRTAIPVTLDREASLTLEIVDLAGRRVKTLHQGHLGVGRHEFIWSGADALGRRVSSGVYYSRLVGQDGRAETKPMVLVK